MKMIPPYYEAPALVNMGAAGTSVLQTCRADRGKTAMLIGKGIVEVVLNRPFFIVVANISNSSITVLKHTEVAELTEYFLLVVTVMNDYAKQHKPVTAITVYNEKVDKGALIREHQAITTRNAEKAEKTGGIKRISTSNITNTATY